MESIFARLLHTPLSDLLRGQITGSLNWRQILASAELPPEIQSLVSNVVASTRLGRKDKLEVALELLCHFDDGLLAGATTEQLVQAFGDPRQAAQLIRRSRIRAYSLRRQIVRFALPAFALFLILYSALAAFYYSGTPSLSPDSLSALTIQTDPVPQDQQAWPIYQSVLRSCCDPQSARFLTASSDCPQSPELARWIDEHQPAIQAICRATSLPALGNLPTVGNLPAPGRSSSDQSSANRSQRQASGNAVNALVPRLADLRLIANLLALDATRASRIADPPRLERDLLSLLDFAAQQQRSDQPRVGEWMAPNAFARAYDQLDRTLVESPQLLDDNALSRIANRLSLPKTAGDIINFRGEKLLFQKVLDLAYTDDGHGDGRFAAAGWQFVRDDLYQSPDLPQQVLIDHAVGAALQPASVFLFASRKELQTKFDTLMDLNQAIIRIPLRQANVDAPYQQRFALNRTWASQWRYALLLSTMPLLEREAELAEQSLGQRDGLLVGLALQRFYRAQHRYPQTLAQLTPDLLPDIPPDRITGEPLRYRLIHRMPIVYSVGMDRVDDGGQLPIVNGKPAPFAAARWGPFAKMVTGDWILFPKPRL